MLSFIYILRIIYNKPTKLGIQTMVSYKTHISVFNIFLLSLMNCCRCIYLNHRLRQLSTCQAVFIRYDSLSYPHSYYILDFFVLEFIFFHSSTILVISRYAKWKCYTERSYIESIKFAILEIIQNMTQYINIQLMHNQIHCVILLNFYIVLIQYNNVIIF